jgi:thiol reductant ABC exporter CydC subunit
MRNLWGFLQTGGAWPRLALAVLAGLGAAGAAIGLTATSAWLIARASQQPPVLYLMVAIVAVRAFGISRGALRYAERLAAHDAAFRVLGALRVRAYRRLERLAPAGLAELRSGDLLARLVGDVDGLADLWLRVALPGAVVVLAAGGGVALVAWLLPSAGLVLFVSVALAGIAAPLAAGAVAARADRSVAPARGRLAAATLELLRGAPEITVAGAAARRLGAIAGEGRALHDAERNSAFGAGTSTLLTGLSAGLAVWLSLIVGIVAVREGTLAGVALAVVVLTPIAVHELVAGLGPAAQHLHRQAAAATRVREVLDRPDPVRAPAGVAAADERLFEDWRGPPGLRIADLAAAYPTGPEIFRGLNLDIPAGGTALLTGPSGCGKTTLTNVLLRFLDPAQGTVELRLGGRSVSLVDLPEDVVRRVIGLAPQDVHLFDTTLDQNLLLAAPGSDAERLAAAVRSAGLAAWVDTLPDGLAASLGEHGWRVSAGQRQRIGLARAILADRPVIVFDEPTEHLDPETAEQLTADLLRFAVGRTALFITHRPELMAALGDAIRVDLHARTPAHLP